MLHVISTYGRHNFPNTPFLLFDSGVHDVAAVDRPSQVTRLSRGISLKKESRVQEIMQTAIALNNYAGDVELTLLRAHAI